MLSAALLQAAILVSASLSLIRQPECLPENAAHFANKGTHPRS